jgi:hypothetical protein
MRRVEMRRVDLLSNQFQERHLFFYPPGIADGLPRVTPTNTDDAFQSAIAEKVHRHVYFSQRLFMYKFMFFALVVCAVYPDWPIEAVAAGQEIIEGFQSKVMVVSQNG